MCCVSQLLYCSHASVLTLSKSLALPGLRGSTSGMCVWHQTWLSRWNWSSKQGVSAKMRVHGKEQPAVDDAMALSLQALSYTTAHGVIPAACKAVMRRSARQYTSCNDSPLHNSSQSKRMSQGSTQVRMPPVFLRTGLAGASLAAGHFTESMSDWVGCCHSVSRSGPCLLQNDADARACRRGILRAEETRCEAPHTFSGTGGTAWASGVPWLTDEPELEGLVGNWPNSQCSNSCGSTSSRGR